MTTLRLRADRLRWLASDGEIIALDEEAFVYLSANSTGTVLWEALARGSTREALVRVLLDEFDIDESTAAADVDRFVDDLEARGFLDADPKPTDA